MKDGETVCGAIARMLLPLSLWCASTLLVTPGVVSPLWLEHELGNDPRTRRRRRIARVVATAGRNEQQARRQIKIQVETLKGIHFAKGKHETETTVLRSGQWFRAR